MRRSPSNKLPLAERFWAKVNKTDGCWVWTGFADKPRRPSSPAPGYGMFHIGRKVHRAHRVAWALTFGEVPDGASVLHHCDHPLCVRPDHLFLGTQLDNMRDMIAKNRRLDTTGRERPEVQGERHPKAKMTEANVRLLRQLRAEGWTLTALADRFGIADNTAYYISTRKTWKHVE